VYRLRIFYQEFAMASASKPGSSRAKTSRAKPSRVKLHRDRLRRQGLRLIQIWVPDVGAPAFQSAAHRQSLAVAASFHGRHDQALIDSVSAFDADGDE